MIRDVVQGIEERGVLGECDGVLSGYMGSADIGEAILDAVATREARQSGGALLLRSGDRRCRPRHLCARRHPGIHARARARRPPMSSRPTSSSSSSCPVSIPAHWRAGSAAIDALHALRASARACDLGADRRHAGRCHRHDSRPTATGRFRLRTPLLPIVDQRRGRCHRGACSSRIICASRLGRRGAVARGSSLFGVLSAPPNGARAKSCWSKRRRRFVKPSRRVSTPSGRSRKRSQECHMRRAFRHPRCVHANALRRQSAGGGAGIRRPRHGRRCRPSRASSTFPRPSSCCSRPIRRIVRCCASSRRQRELPFAGHPTVGTAVLLGCMSGYNLGGHDMVLEETVGPVHCTVEAQGREQGRASFVLPRLPERDRQAHDVGGRCSGSGARPERGRYRFRHRRRAGRPGCLRFVPVRDLDAMATREAGRRPFDAAFGDGGPAMAYLYCGETTDARPSLPCPHVRAGTRHSWRIRRPAPRRRRLPAVVMEESHPADGEHRFVIEQGYEMGRPSQIELGMTVQGGTLTRATIGGGAVIVSDGHIEA